MTATIDMYSPCPCGSGKKVKFCCRELVGEFERLENMVQGGQRKAALEHVQRLLAQRPNHSFLRSCQVQLLYDLEEYEQADQVVQQWVQREPENPLALGWCVISMLSQAAEEEEPQEAQKLFRLAIMWFQRALSCCTSGEKLPEVISHALVLLLRMAVELRAWMVVVGHMALAQQVTDSARANLAEIWDQVCKPAAAPSWVRYQLLSVTQPRLPGPQIPQWEKVASLLAKAHFLQAQTELEALVQGHPDHAGLWHQLGLVRAYLDNLSGAAEAFHRAAAAQSEPVPRIWELLWAFVHEELGQLSLPLLIWTMELPQQQALEVVKNHPQLTPSRLPEARLAAVYPLHQQGALWYEVWDRPTQQAHPQENLPLHRGSLVVQGKGDAQVEVVLFEPLGPGEEPRGGEWLASLWPQGPQPQLKTKKENALPLPRWLGQTSTVFVPQGEKNSRPWEQATLKHRVGQFCHRMPLRCLQGRTLAQAAEDRQAHPAAQAVVLFLESLDSSLMLLELDGEDLRRQLGLAVPARTRIATPQELFQVPAFWLHRLDVHGWDEKMWEMAMAVARQFWLGRAAVFLAHACWEQGPWRQSAQVAMLLASLLSRVPGDPQQLHQRFEYLRSWVQEHTEAYQCASWDVLGIQLLARFWQEGFRDDLLQLCRHVIQDHPQTESAVQLALTCQQIVEQTETQEQLLQQMESHLSPVVERPTLWTPDQQSPGTPAASGKLWTPE